MHAQSYTAWDCGCGGERHCYCLPHVPCMHNPADSVPNRLRGTALDTEMTHYCSLPSVPCCLQDCWHGNPRVRPSFTDIVARLEGMLQKWAMPPNPAAAHAAVQAAAAGGGRPAPGGVPNGA